MIRAVDRVGQRFGRLVAVAVAPYGPKSTAHLNCQCDCGTDCVVRLGDLRSGRTKSCGCLHTETSRETGYRNRIHGRYGTPEYKAWCGMKSRCTPNATGRKYYYDRGIRVHRSWSESFEAFFAHIGPMPSPGLEVDRIDNDKGYLPGNVRWADQKLQANNRRQRQPRA